LIVVGLLWGRFKAMHVFAAPVLLLILSGFMGIKHIYATAINPFFLFKYRSDSALCVGFNSSHCNIS
jgi:hypothetical protein